jgi:biotin transport system substrate-specific component
MAVTLTTPNTILGTLQPKGDAAKLVTNLATVVMGSLLLAISARISVPVMPVPVTLQTLAVAVIAAGFGWRIGVATVALYIVEGLSGLPVFATGGGLDYITRPSFGFIIGYLPMAFIIGRAADLGASRKLLPMFLAAVVGDAVAFAFGFAWLLGVSALILQQGAALPSWLDQSNLLASAFNGAVKPFIVWDIVKMAFAALTVTGIWAALRRKA